jgi:hypothetical protein
MSAGKLSEYILAGVLLFLIGYLWLVTILVQAPKGA